MCDDNNEINNCNDDEPDSSDSTATQTDDNDTDSDEAMFEEMLKELDELDEEQQKLNTQLNLSSEYIGNGFINLTITECNALISQFELKYCFHNDIADKLTFETLTFSPRKFDGNTLLIRIPQRLTDYFFTFEFRGCVQQQTQEPASTPCSQWTLFSAPTSILVPFDAPQYQFKCGEIVHFQQPDNPFWSLGKIIKISDDVAHILYKVRDKEDELFKIAVNSLKFKQRYRNKLIDLTDWMDLSKQLLLNVKDENVERVYVLLYNILESNMFKWILDSNSDNEEERMSCIDLVYLGDIEQDMKCCCRFIALNVVTFLGESGSNMARAESDYDIIDNNLSISCGLCPIQSHYKTKSRLRNIWHSKILAYSAYSKENELESSCDWFDMLQTGVGTMCDICLIGFHHMSYLYVCASPLEQQHDICVPCMNRNVLQYKRLQKLLNELYFIHGLDHYCVSQIVFCLVGWVSLND